VTPVDSDMEWCEPITSGTLQLVVTVPPAAVPELRGVLLRTGDYLILLQGSVENP